jgi:REP element-mobilizing transposase RayT
MVAVPTYEYRRRLPHFQKADRAVFVTFCKLTREPLSEQARNLVLQHCLYEHGRRMELHAAVIMPDHVHLLFTPLRDEDGWPVPVHRIMKAIKGTSARDVNQSLGVGGPVWQDESFDHVLRSEEKLARKD